MEIKIKPSDDFQPADTIRRRDYHPPLIIKKPDNWKVLSGVDWQRPVFVEVGCGTGEWIVAEAARRPDHQFIAIEKTQNRSEILIQRAISAACKNLIAVRADAVAIVGSCFPEKSVDGFYFLHPNPWPKKRQANRRFFVGPSFAVFDRCLKPGGTIELASNTRGYVDEAAHALTTLWGYRIVTHQTLSATATPRTAFERKYLARGETIYQLIVSRI